MSARPLPAPRRPAREGGPGRAAAPVPARALSPASPPPARRRAGRGSDPERTRADILRAALHVFGDKGLAGARIDAIAAATGTSKRMIYYYFGSKNGLYLAALEASYARVREQEGGIDIEAMDPQEGLRCLVGVMFDHHLGNEDYIRLVMSENMNRARLLARSTLIQQLNRPTIERLRAVYERGVSAGVFRPGLDVTDLHASIAALNFFNVSNRYTFGLIFGLETQSSSYQAERRRNIIEMVLRYVLAP